jgi:hypothetical protein
MGGQSASGGVSACRLRTAALIILIGGAIAPAGGAARPSGERWLVPPASAVSLGDSYAVGQLEPLGDQLGVEVLDLGQAGSFAWEWLDSADSWIPLVRRLPGPVLVVLTVGHNDELSPSLGLPPETVAERISGLASALLVQRRDLQVVVTGYSGRCAEVEFPAYLPADTDRYRYIETQQLDRRLSFRDSCHPTERGYAKRVRYVLRESRHP